MADESGRHIGPYHLRERLASGGMGVVYDAYDERLERRVAIKHLRPADAADPLRRQRFRREARAAAKLNHPAVVQIHDIVERPEGDWIVMEFVEGQTLAQLMRQGPLEPERLLRLAWEIAGGLAEAHDKGILHRDLKADNVIATPAGHAKILDFGLAKPYWPERAVDRLSLTGVLLGTSRAMSPEQANGEELDPRSDLFSFGSLLYEILTGVSPFLAKTNLLTIERVCHYHPPPVSQYNPEVPAALSELVGQMLEKDREHRPRNAREVADRLAAILRTLPASARAGALIEPHTDAAYAGTTTLEIHPWHSPMPLPPSQIRSQPPEHRRPWWPLAVVLAAVASGAALWYLTPPDTPLAVAVLAPEVGLSPPGTDVERIATAVHAALLAELAARGGIRTLTPEPGMATGTSQEIARMLAADEVLSSRLDCGPEVCHVALHRRRGSDSRLLWEVSVEAASTDPAQVARTTVAALRRGLGESPLRGGGPASPEPR